MYQSLLLFYSTRFFNVRETISTRTGFCCSPLIQCGVRFLKALETFIFQNSLKCSRVGDTLGLETVCLSCSVDLIGHLSTTLVLIIIRSLSNVGCPTLVLAILEDVVLIAGDRAENDGSLNSLESEIFCISKFFFSLHFLICDGLYLGLL